MLRSMFPSGVAVQAATSPDASEILRLRDEAAAWLITRGIEQWRPGEISREVIVTEVERGEWHVLREQDAVVGAFRLIWTDLRTWADDGGRTAGYLHGLVIDRRNAGSRLGAAILSWAEARVRSRAGELLRLDCVESNGRLRGYYQARGFAEVGRRDFAEKMSSVILCEKHVGPGNANANPSAPGAYPLSRTRGRRRSGPRAP